MKKSKEKFYKIPCLQELITDRWTNRQNDDYRAPTSQFWNLKCIKIGQKIKLYIMNIRKYENTNFRSFGLLVQNLWVRTSILNPMRYMYFQTRIILFNVLRIVSSETSYCTLKFQVNQSNETKVNGWKPM